MSIIETRGHQMFPVLDPGQIETARRFASGPPRDFAPGETVFDVGERHAPAWLVLKGSIDAIGRDGHGRETLITTHHAGQFSGELSQLAGRQSLAIGRAGAGGATAIPFDDVHVRALMIGSAEIGEIMMRAFILRRVGLIDEGRAGSTLIGTPGTPDLVRIEGFLGRNGYPYTVLDPAEDLEAKALLERAGVSDDELPVMCFARTARCCGVQPMRRLVPVSASRRNSMPRNCTTSP
jgi:thioredoxin reductase (NADPH)